MKKLYWAAGIIVLLVAAVLGLQILASERVEVVELHTIDAEGEPQTTRLWIVDDGGFAYLRTGTEGSGWFSRLQANGTFELTRNGERKRYGAVLRQDKSSRINELMQQKYTWGDTLIGLLLGSREGSIPVELRPLD